MVGTVREIARPRRPGPLPNTRLKLTATVLEGRIAFVNVRARRRSSGANPLGGNYATFSNRCLLGFINGGLPPGSGKRRACSHVG